MAGYSLAGADLRSVPRFEGLDAGALPIVKKLLINDGIVNGCPEPVSFFLVLPCVVIKKCTINV